MPTRTPHKILKLPAVMEKTGLGRDSVYRLAREDAFPKPLKLARHASGWLEAEIDEWIESRIESRSDESVSPKKNARAQPDKRKSNERRNRGHASVAA